MLDVQCLYLSHKSLSMSFETNLIPKIAVDAMGGDFAPRNTVIGAISALDADQDIELILVGQKDKIEKEIADNNLKFDSDKIVDASEVIEMFDSPTGSLKSKPDSSIVVGAVMVRDRKADAFVSAGNTGAMMAASTLLTGRIKGVGRPTIGAAFPTNSGKVCNVYDVGASVDSKPEHLFEYAVMGSIFVSEMQGTINPTIGTLSVGEEDKKGNELVKNTNILLKNSDLNFIGNVEGRDILNGSVDIVVCDGFVGNIILKFGESFLDFMKGRVKSYSNSGIVNKLQAGITRNVLRSSLKDMDYQAHGGAPLLGINGISIIGHGSSSPLAIRNMVLRAKEMYDRKLISKIEKSIKSYSVK